MHPRSVLFLLGILLLPAAATAAPVDFVVKVTDEFDLATLNATVQLTPVNLSNVPLVGTTNATGQARFAALETGLYHTLVQSPHDEPETWYNGTLTVGTGTNFTHPSKLRRNLPSLQGIAAWDAPGNDTTRELRVGQTLIVQVTVRVPLNMSGSVPVWALIELYPSPRNATSTPLFTQATAVREATNASLQLNLTVSPLNGTAFNQLERNLTLAVSLYGRVQGTLHLLDRSLDLPLPVVDECAGTTQSYAFSLGGQTFRFCTRPTQRTDLDRLQANATALFVKRQAWTARLRGNVSDLSTDTLLQRWREYEADTRLLNANVSQGLSRFQTDLDGIPRWTDLDRVTQTLAAADAAVTNLLADELSDQDDATTASTRSHLLLFAATTFGLGVAAAGVGVLVGFLLVRRWKRLMEYWTGYSATAQAPSPLRRTFLLVAATWFMSLLLFALLWGTHAAGAYFP